MLQLFISVITTLSMLMSGCSNENNNAINDLNHFIEANPVLAKKSLKQIQKAASGEDSTIKQDQAQRAQELIKNSINSFDIKAMFEGKNKLDGIILNEATVNADKILADIESGKYEGDDKDKVKLAIENFKKNPPPPCNKLVGDAQKIAASSGFDKAIDFNKNFLKESLSTCDSINSSRLNQCLTQYNNFWGMVNKFASCDFNSLYSLHTAIEDNTGSDINALEQSVTSCINKDFAKCGYRPQLPSSTSSKESK